MIKKYFIGFFLLIMMLIEWVCEVILKIVNVIHEGVKELTLALDRIYNELNLRNEPDS